MGRCSMFHETSMAANITMPVSSTMGAEMPSRPRLKEMFMGSSSHVKDSVNW